MSKVSNPILPKFKESFERDTSTTSMFIFSSDGAEMSLGMYTERLKNALLVDLTKEIPSLRTGWVHSAS